MEWIVYMMVAGIVFGDVLSAQYINKQRKKLDLATEEGRARDKKLRLVIAAVLGYSFVVSVLLLVFLKPLFTS
jgi:hypothetical protein